MYTKIGPYKTSWWVGFFIVELIGTTFIAVGWYFYDIDVWWKGSDDFGDTVYVSSRVLSAFLLPLGIIFDGIFFYSAIYMIREHFRKQHPKAAVFLLRIHKLVGVFLVVCFLCVIVIWFIVIVIWFNM